MSGSGASGSGRRRGRPPVRPPVRPPGFTSQAQDTSGASSSGAASTSGRKKRGEAKATDTWRRAHGTFHDVDISPCKSFVGNGGKEVKNFMSSIANNELRMPHLLCIDGQWIPLDWASPQLQPFKDRAITEVMGRFRFKWVTSPDEDSPDESEVDERIVQEIVLKYIDGSWRDHKHIIYRKLKKANTPEEIAEAKPQNWSQDYWDAMLQHYNGEQYLSRSQRGQIAQAYCEDHYRGGGKGASERGYEMYQAGGHWPDRSVIYDQLFVRDDTTEASQEARERSQSIHHHIDELETQRGQPFTQEERYLAADDAMQTYYRDDTSRMHLAGQFISSGQYYAPHIPSRRPPRSRRTHEHTPSETPSEQPSVPSSSQPPSEQQSVPSSSQPPSEPRYNTPLYGSPSMSADERLALVGEYYRRGQIPPAWLFGPN